MVKARAAPSQNMVGAGAMGHAASVLFCHAPRVLPFMMFPAAVIGRDARGTSAEGLSVGADDDTDSFLIQG